MIEVCVLVYNYKYSDLLSQDGSEDEFATQYWKMAFKFTILLLPLCIAKITCYVLYCRETANKYRALTIGFGIAIT